MKSAVLFSLALAAVAAAAFAQPHAAPTPEEIVRALQPASVTRSISGASPTRNLKPMVDLTVSFGFDSALLREEGKTPLKHLVSALGDARLSGLRFRVEGHTDAKGTASYNEALSERRAQAVVSFLTAQGVAVDRLESVGMGFKELLDPNHPEAPQNRRVRIVTLP